MRATKRQCLGRSAKQRSERVKGFALGAPVGHPFFGNQHTDGGYVLGSFGYKNAVQDVVDATAKASQKIFLSKAANESSYGSFLKAPPAGLPAGSIAGLIAVGAAVVIGGVATFVYLRSRSKSTGDQLPVGDDIAGFGLCESCGEELAASGPAEVEQDDDGDFIICEACSHKNRAYYSSGDESDVPVTDRTRHD